VRAAGRTPPLVPTSRALIVPVGLGLRRSWLKPGSLVDRMSRFTDIELTSRTSDGAWTWRAAGARQPRGTVSSDLVPAEGRVGDVLRAEIESGLDGVEVVSLLAPKQPRRADERAQRIEVLGGPSSPPGVVIQLARGSRLGDRESSARPRRDERPRRDGPGRPRREGRPGGPRRDERPGEGDRTRPVAQERRPRDEDRRAGPRRNGPPVEGESRGARTDRSTARREHRPSVSATHRNAALAALRPEQLAVAEQLLRGGIPAVRQAIDEQNATARGAGQPPVAAQALLSMAEELLPVVNLAAWKDRATAAQAAGRSMRLRELRAVVAASRTVPLDEEARVLARALQESLNERVNHLREEWHKRIESALDSGRVFDALQVSARPPEIATRCPADVAVRLSQAASSAMTADIPSEEWLALLSAVLESPVRRTVKPLGVPESPEARQAARKGFRSRLLLPAVPRPPGARSAQ